jgi:hypothetical protein
VNQCINKWGALLEGIPDRSEQQRYVLGLTAMLMENQSQHLRGVDAQTMRLIDEETRGGNVGPFTKYIFPILRRVFPNLIAHELVSVQPMTAPIGAVFFLDYIYGTTKGSTTAGNVFPRDFNRDYSSEFIDGEIAAVGDGAAFGGVGTGLDVNLGFTPVRPLNAERGFSVTVRELDSAGATVQEAVDNGAGGFTGDVTAGSLNYANGSLTGFLFTVAPVAGNSIKVFYFYDGELNTKIPQVNLDVRKAPVEAVPRRLKALWSSEAAEDLRAFHGIDAETELVSAVAQEISLEIDREIIQELFQNSTGTTGVFDRAVPAGITEHDHLRSMITVISTVANTIHKKTLRQPANFIVTSPEVSALFAQLTTHGDFKPLYSAGMAIDAPVDLPRPMGTHGQFGIYRTGTMMNKWRVYEDPFFSTDQMLVGLKGMHFLEAGFVWAPYIPLQVTPTFLDPSDFSFRKGLRTRYAKKLLRPDYYGQIRVQNL